MVLDDQYFAWDDLDNGIVDQDDTNVENNKTTEDQSYMDYVVSEILKTNKPMDSDEKVEDRESIKFLKELSKQFQE